MTFIFFAIFLLLNSVVAAGEEPFEFKGIVLGSNIAVVESNPRFSCKDRKDAIADQQCQLYPLEKETIAGQPIQSLSLYYYDRKLHWISILLDERHFSQVLLALVEKYGRGETKTELVHNRMGATFENKIQRWRRAAATLEAKRYSTDLKTSYVEYRTDYGIEELKRRARSEIKDKSRDL